MAETDDEKGRGVDKADRRAARALITAYHQAELRTLLEHVRTGFTQLDSGSIDDFELDDLIHHYKRSANELWNFCGSSGSQWVQAASALTYMRERSPSSMTTVGARQVSSNVKIGAILADPTGWDELAGTSWFTVR